MNKLALSTTFEKWIESNDYSSKLKGNLSIDIDNLVHDMVLNYFLPRLPENYAYCFENKKGNSIFEIRDLRNNFLYNVGYIIFYEDNVWHCSGFYDERNLDVNEMSKVLKDLFGQMFKYYKKYNIGTNR